MSAARERSPVRVSVLVPVYNEAASVREAIERLRDVPLQLEIIAVNDGSGDDSGKVLDLLMAEGVVDKVIHHSRNRGKGASVRSALALATGDVVVVQDADLEYDPAELPRLLEPIVQNKADAVYGSRFQSGPRRVLYFWHSMGNRFLTLVSNMLTNVNLTDVETCYKMMRRDLAQSLPLTSDRFGIEVELTARLAQAKARIWELPISYSGRTYEEGKKIGWQDGVAALWHILRFNLFPRRPAPAVSRTAEAARR
ncbi:MAG: glycosyltransferase family 2 protein [Gemmatimonadales bacterium]